MKKLIFIILGLIVYGSLYPFQFTFEIPSSIVINKLLDFNIFHTKITDVVANVLLFIPLGILLFYRSLNIQQSLFSMLLLCFIFAFMIQVTQLYLEARVAYGADAIWNVIGFANGMAIGSLINRYYQLDPSRLERDKIIGFVLLALLIVALLRPFSPTLDPGLIWQNVKQLYALETVNLSDVFDSLAIYILFVAVITQLKIRLKYTSLLVSLSLLLQFFMVDGGALLNDITAAILVIPLFFLGQRFKSYSIWSGLAVACYFFANVTPFEFSDSIKRFYEIPFQAYLSGSMIVNASAIIYKFTFFVTILWLVRNGEVSLRKMTALLAGIILIIELLQTRLLFGTPDITDVLLVLFAGWLTQTQLLPLIMARDTDISNLQIQQKAPKRLLGFNIDLIFVMCSIVIAQALIMRLPNLPYNVSELYGETYGIVNYVFLAAAYLLFCIGAVWVARGIIKKDFSVLKAPLYAAIVSMLVLVCLYLSVTKESVMDINGSSNIIYQLTGERILGEFVAEFVLWLGTENVAVVTRLIEPYIRFAALTGPLIYLLIFWTLLFHLINEPSSQRKVRKVARYALSFLPWFFLCKLIAFDYSSTDNLNELIARDGDYGLGGGGYLYLLLVLLTFTVVFSAWSLRFKGIKFVLLSVLMFILSLPINWFLLNNGLEQQVQKYGNVFSGVDFLLGPNRSVILEQNELFARWVFVNIGIYLALSVGILLGLKQFLLKSTSAETQVDSAVKNKNFSNGKKYMKSGMFIIILSISAVFIVSISHKTIKTYPTPSWAINDANLIIDLHTHSKFSDGNLPISELAALAFKNGCSALAITDHANYTPAYSAERQNEIAAARIKYPDMLIFNGLELNPPPYKGREHVNMITLPKHENMWMKHMQKLHQAGLKEELDPQTYFKRVVPAGLSAQDFFAIYNHPSRKDEVEEENFQDFMKWRTSSTVLSAMSGGPGHQRNSPIGSYRTFFSTINRWDPVVATTGGTLDKMLGEGQQIWGAIAVSDYHNNSLDYAPCEFARIRLTAPAITYEGVIEALNAGTFFADQGRLFNQLKLRVVGEESNDIYAAGSVVSSVKKHSLVSVIVEIERDDGSFALPVEVALISNCVSGRTEEFAIKPISAFDNTSIISFLPIENTGSDGNSCYLRAKLSAEVNGEKLHAFTNHIRFML